MSLVLLAAGLGNVGRVIVLLNGEPSDLDEPHLHEAVSVSAAAAIPALRGIDLHGHHHTRLGLQNRGWRLAGPSVRAEPAPDNEQHGEAGPPVAAGSALLERPPPDVPPAACDRLAAALIPPSGSDAVAWTTDIAQPGSGKGAAERLFGIEPHRVRVGDSSMTMSVSFSGCTQHYRQPQ
jgi:hypothetical protein